jgi:SAM-dependent methyltransferase
MDPAPVSPLAPPWLALPPSITWGACVMAWARRRRIGDGAVMMQAAMDRLAQLASRLRGRQAPGSPAGAVTAEEVRLAYLLLLGREPESEAVVREWVASGQDMLSLRQAFMGGTEFAEKVAPIVRPLVLPLDVPPIEVETRCTSERFAALLERVGRFWREAGETRPHHSVITNEAFRPERIARNLDAFLGGGRHEVGNLLAMLARQGLGPADFRHVVDYGCGVGRMTLELARHFAQVSALDISEPHMRLAAHAVREAGLSNVHFATVSVEALLPATGFDLWFSVLVLQHNPPPVALRTLDLAFEQLAPGGLAVFQVPVYRRGYRFVLDEQLAGEPVMEMHVLPQRDILELAAAHGCRLLELRDDTHVVAQSSEWLSNRFVFRKG